ncbi:MAG: alkaline phosphatase [Candidatus Thorarchaeota archaeon]|nr:alkaline phosphatase [Candidatus Thorarchaeota archaeon]
MMRLNALACAVIILFMASCLMTTDTSHRVYPQTTVLVFANGAPHSIILMIGDGMGHQHVELGALVERGVLGDLTMETIGFETAVNTSSANSLITDSAAAATAMATGRKTNNGILSMTPQGTPLETIVELAQQLNKSTGVVSTCEVTHATPAAFLSHVMSRSNTSEIARQIVEVSNVDTIMGGGLSQFTAAQLDMMTSKGYTVVYNRTQLLSVSSGRVLGLFASSHMAYEADRDYDVEPSLAEMTDKALTLLSSDPDGFFLMVEGGKIDLAAHSNDRVNVALDVIAFDYAVLVASRFVQQHPGTMLIVTADHETGGLSITGDTLNDELPSQGLTEEQNRTLRVARANNVSVTWSSTYHTAALVPLYLNGAVPSSWANCTFIDNTDIYYVSSEHLLLDVPQDNVSPEVVLVSPVNCSVVRPVTEVFLEVTDWRLDTVVAQWDDESESVLTNPYVVTVPSNDGWHTLLVRANDTSGNTAEVAFVWLVDGTRPTIVPAGNVSLVQGNVSQKLSWRAQDANPSSYAVLVDGIVVLQGVWNSSAETVTVGLSEFGVGVFNVTIVFIDSAGNRAWDVSIVTVSPASADLSTVSLIGLAAGGVGLFALLLFVVHGRYRKEAGTQDVRGLVD